MLNTSPGVGRGKHRSVVEIPREWGERLAGEEPKRLNKRDKRALATRSNTCKAYSIRIRQLVGETHEFRQTNGCLEKAGELANLSQPVQPQTNQ